MMLNFKLPQNNRRNEFLEMMKVSINIGIPIILTLGYELIEYSKHPEKYRSNPKEIVEIHEVLVKFISCHTAYLRAICQYYLSKYL